MKCQQSRPGLELGLRIILMCATLDFSLSDVYLKEGPVPTRKTNENMLIATESFKNLFDQNCLRYCHSGYSDSYRNSWSFLPIVHFSAGQCNKTRKFIDTLMQICSTGLAMQHPLTCLMMTYNLVTLKVLVPIRLPKLSSIEPICIRHEFTI